MKHLGDPDEAPGSCLPLDPSLGSEPEDGRSLSFRLCHSAFHKNKTIFKAVFGETGFVSLHDSLKEPPTPMLATYT